MNYAVLFIGLGLLATTPVMAETLQADDFRIAYETFLANGDLEEAYQLAQRISNEKPRDMTWQRRLARVSDWSNRPTEAYRAWLVLYRSKIRDKEVMNAIRRLSDYFNDATILLELLQAKISAGMVPSIADADTLVILYERAYRADDGARYMEQIYHRFRKPYLGKKAAEFYQRTGHDDQALRLFRAMSKQNPSDRENLLTTARLEIRNGSQNEALRLLKTYRPYAKEDDFDFWQMLGDMAWILQDTITATDAYSYLALSPNATEEKRLRVFELLMLDDPKRAADVAVRFYRIGERSIWLQRALSLYVAQNEWRAARQVLGEGNRKAKSILQRNPTYLALRSQVAAHFNHLDAAAHDMLHAIALDPENDELLISALWLFSDSGNRAKLQQVLNALPASPPPDYWHVLAVSYQVLGSQSMAIEYYRMLLKRTPSNPALQLEYADLLQRSGDAASAARIRSTVWKQLQSNKNNDAEGRLHLARLLLAEQPGDSAAYRIQQLLKSDPGMPAITTKQRDELLLSWAIETGWRESARNWVAHHYTNSGEPLPQWAVLHLALEAHDHNTLQALLANGGSDLPADSAYDASMALGRWALARKLAFEGLQQSPSNIDLHQRLVDVNTQHGNWWQLTAQTAHYDALDSSGYRFKLEQAYSENVRLGIDWRSTKQSLTNLDTLQTAPSNDDSLTLYGKWQNTEQTWRLGISQSDELNRYTGWTLEMQQQIDRRLQWSTSLATRQSVDYSLPLQMTSTADHLMLGLDYVPERHFRVGLSGTTERYHTQYDAYLGSGSRINWEIGYWIQENYPDWSIRLSGDHYRFTADGTPDASTLSLLDPDTVLTTPIDQQAALFVPEDDNYYALCMGTGGAIRESGSRILRPFTDLCAIHSDNFGDGYSLIAGIAGSLYSGDHFSLTLEQSNASMQTDNGNTQILNLSYQFIF